MKHITRVSSRMPVPADQWQDLICEIAHQTALVIQAKGGSLPFITYLDEKCTETTSTYTENSPYWSI